MSIFSKIHHPVSFFFSLVSSIRDVAILSFLPKLYFPFPLLASDLVTASLARPLRWKLNFFSSGIFLLLQGGPRRRESPSKRGCRAPRGPGSAGLLFPLIAQFLPGPAAMAPAAPWQLRSTFPPPADGRTSRTPGRCRVPVSSRPRRSPRSVRRRVLAVPEGRPATRRLRT